MDWQYKITAARDPQFPGNLLVIAWVRAVDPTGVAGAWQRGSSYSVREPFTAGRRLETLRRVVKCLS